MHADNSSRLMAQIAPTSKSILMPENPNILFVMCDQLRADFLSMYGCAAISTPNLDALSEQSTIYSNAISPYPLCVPARAALLTGLNPLQSGVLTNHQWLRTDRSTIGYKTWPDLLRTKGYRTASIGKMHFHPFEAAEGFDERIIAEDKRWPKVHDDYAEFLAQSGRKKFDARTHPDYKKNKGSVVYPDTVETTVDHFVANETIEFIQRQPEGRSFAVMVGFPSPHCPYDALPEFANTVDTEKLPELIHRSAQPTQEEESFYQNFLENHRKDWHSLDYEEFTLAQRLSIRKQYAGLIKQIDEEFGRIVQACKDKGVWENTLVVFTSDHGDHVGDRSMVGKGDFYQESIHIPLIVKAADQQTSSRVDAPVELQQVAATLLESSGSMIPAWWHYTPLPLSDRPDVTRDIFGILGNGCMVQRGSWKFVSYQLGLTELFNLDEDPTETTNLADHPEYLEIRLKLEASVRKWLMQSALSGHHEKQLTHGIALCESDSFAQRGWERNYPLPLPPQ
ncbi:sulfatase-like hydrolase/transferase [Coraliomargarita sp. SDUM461004]|uniref:Sulfatase-like hydrolase/transferase n=1 Tax=Thalassobacterium sedimentorum TaxID=3041258 RepID=A0ABU1AIP1_9BACT|nr:sulfatase-like hydrolase/transferase [Coraliomargarita sp. SDUM461004]MDQ8194687.1 sulfatase-like hydrolase/transferase [Coraliomargarita sp. SDUM461004]